MEHVMSTFEVEHEHQGIMQYLPRMCNSLEWDLMIIIRFFFIFLVHTIFQTICCSVTSVYNLQTHMFITLNCMGESIKYWAQTHRAAQGVTGWQIGVCVGGGGESGYNTESLSMGHSGYNMFGECHAC